MKKTVKIISLDKKNRDLEYWLSKSPEERIEAVEILRKQYHGSTERLQRVVRIVKQTLR